MLLKSPLVYKYAYKNVCYKQIVHIYVYAFPLFPHSSASVLLPILRKQHLLVRWFSRANPKHLLSSTIVLLLLLLAQQPILQSFPPPKPAPLHLLPPHRCLSLVPQVSEDGTPLSFGSGPQREPPAPGVCEGGEADSTGGGWWGSPTPCLAPGQPGNSWGLRPLVTIPSIHSHTLRHIHDFPARSQQLSHVSAFFLFPQNTQQDALLSSR